MEGMIIGSVILILGYITGYCVGVALHDKVPANKVIKKIKKALSKNAKIIDTSPEIDLGNEEIN